MIGVLGASGGVGREIVARLGGRAVRAGARRRPEVAGGCAVDVHDPIALAGFVAGCRVVVDATGPVRETGPVIARAAADAGAGLVAVGAVPVGPGRAERRGGIPAAGPVVVGCGTDPGLTGLLPRALARRYGPVAELVVWTAVHDRFGRTAAHEWVDAAAAGARLPGTVWHAGAPVRATQAPPDPFRAGVAGLPVPVASGVALGAAEEAVAAELGLRRGTWVSVLFGARVAATMARLPGLPRGAAVAELVRASTDDLGGDAPLVVLAAEADGCRSLVVRAPGDAVLSGAVAAAAVEQVLDGRVRSGVQAAATALDPGIVLDRLLADEALDCRVLPEPVTTALAAVSGIEEGVL